MKTIRIEEPVGPGRVFPRAPVPMAILILGIVFVAFFGLGRALSSVTAGHVEAPAGVGTAAVNEAIPAALASAPPLDLGTVAVPHPERQTPVSRPLVAAARPAPATAAGPATSNVASGTGTPVQASPPPAEPASPPATSTPSPQPVSNPAPAPAPAHAAPSGGAAKGAGSPPAAVSKSFESSG